MNSFPSLIAFAHLDKLSNDFTPVLTQNKSRPPAPLPYRPSSAGPSVNRHSSMRHLSMSQSHVPDMLAAKKRFTPPPSMSKSMVNKSSISSLNYGNQFRHNNSSHTISDKVNSFFFPFNTILDVLCAHKIPKSLFRHTKLFKENNKISVLTKLTNLGKHFNSGQLVKRLKL